MFDISNPKEARELLEKDEFTNEDSRAILLYLIERDESRKAVAERINAAFIALFEVASVMLEVLPQLPLTPEMTPHLERAKDAIIDLNDLINPDLLVN